MTVAGGGSLEFESWGLATLELTFEEQAITPVIPQRLRVRAPSTAVVSSQPGSTQRIEWTYTGGATAFQIVVPGGWWSYTDNVLLTVPRRPGARQYVDVVINAEYFESALLVRAVGDSTAFDMTAPIVRLPWQVSGATSLSKRGARWALPSSPRLSAAP